MKQIQHSTPTELSTGRNRLEVFVYLAQKVCKKGLEALPPVTGPEILAMGQNPGTVREHQFIDGIYGCE